MGGAELQSICTSPAAHESSDDGNTRARAYGLMERWSAVAEQAGSSATEIEFAKRWLAIDKVAVSSTLAESKFSVNGLNGTQLVRELTLSDNRHIVAKKRWHYSDLWAEIFGPTTAVEALRAGIVDRLNLFIVPVGLGQGRRALSKGAYRKLKLIQNQAFDDGTVYLQYERQ